MAIALPHSRGQHLYEERSGARAFDDDQDGAALVVGRVVIVAYNARRASYQISSLYNLPTVEPDISLLPSRRICDSSKEHSAVTPSEEVCGSISTCHHLEHAAPKRYSKHSGRIQRTLLYNLKSGMRGRQVG